MGLARFRVQWPVGPVVSGYKALSASALGPLRCQSSNLAEVNVCTHMECADDTKLEESVIVLKGRAVTTKGSRQAIVSYVDSFQKDTSNSTFYRRGMLYVEGGLPNLSIWLNFFLKG